MEASGLGDNLMLERSQEKMEGPPVEITGRERQPHDQTQKHGEDFAPR